MTVDVSPLWIVVGLVLFVLGVRWTISQAARRTYENTKAAMPVAKATARGTFWAAVRAAGLILVVVLALSWYDFGRDTSADPASWLRNLVPAGVGDGRTANGDKICFSAECRRLNPEHPRER